MDSPLSASDEEILRQECGQECVDEYRQALANSNADVVDWLADNGLDILLEVIGVNDVRRCFGDGDVESCLWTLVDVGSLVVAVGKLPAVSRAIARVSSEIPAFFRLVDVGKDTVERLRRVIDAARLAPCNSFLPGTGVVMADGTIRAIEDVRIGDLVLATDPETGQTAPRRVTREIVGDGEKNLVDITITSDGTRETITATASHPFWVPALDTWVDADDLRSGQWLRTSAGTRVQITAIEHHTRQATVHNLTVDGFHTFYVAAAGTDVLVHNSTGCIPELADWANRYYQVGSHGQAITLTTERMNHILIRHHPRYWNGSRADTQTFFREDMTIADVEHVIAATVNQNRAAIAELGNAVGGFIGVVDGIRYRVKLDAGRIVQVYPPA